MARNVLLHAAVLVQMLLSSKFEDSFPVGYLEIELNVTGVPNCLCSMIHEI